MTFGFGVITRLILACLVCAGDVVFMVEKYAMKTETQASNGRQGQRHKRFIFQYKSQFSSVVEQRFCKPSVVGSSPTTGSILNCGCSNGLGLVESKTDTNFGIRREPSVTCERRLKSAAGSAPYFFTNLGPVFHIAIYASLLMKMPHF
jgi:hypothetical protein